MKLGTYFAVVNFVSFGDGTKLLNIYMMNKKKRLRKKTWNALLMLVFRYTINGSVRFVSLVSNEEHEFAWAFHGLIVLFGGSLSVFLIT